MFHAYLFPGNFRDHFGYVDSVQSEKAENTVFCTHVSAAHKSPALNASPALQHL